MLHFSYPRGVDDEMQLKEVRKQTGLSEKAIRYYEHQNLIHVEKNNGRKIYDDSTIHRLRQIKWLREHECSIHEIQELFEQSTIDELLQEKLEEVDQSMIQLYQKKLELLQVMQTKEIPEAKPRSNTNLKASYMMVVNMDQFMGWLNVCLFILAFFICFHLKNYELILPIILGLMMLCTFLYKSILEPTLECMKNYQAVAISLKEVLIRSLLNFTSHLGITWIAIFNSLNILNKVITTGKLEFLDFCLIVIGIIPSCVILFWSISHNFQYRAYFHTQ